MSASGDSDANRQYFHGMHYAATADFDLLIKAYNAAKEMNIKTYQGAVFSTNTFYDDTPNRWEKWQKHDILGVEMETQMLFTLAKRFGVKALSVLTVSDNILTGEASSAKEREQSFNDMMKIALHKKRDARVDEGLIRKRRQGIIDELAALLRRPRHGVFPGALHQRPRPCPLDIAFVAIFIGGVGVDKPFLVPDDQRLDRIRRLCA